jgi:hypothetical protein
MKTKQWVPAWILGAVLCAAVPVASAANWVAILKNTPAEDFNDDDIKLFLDSAKLALDAEGPAQESSWNNPASGSGGKFLELSRSSAGGNACKRMRFTLHSRSVSDRSTVWTLCRIDGRWRVKT